MLTSRFIAAVRLQYVCKYFRGFVKVSSFVSNPYKTLCADKVSPSILVNMYTSLYVLYNGTGATLITWPLRSQITPFSWSWANTFSTLVLHSKPYFYILILLLLFKIKVGVNDELCLSHHIDTFFRTRISCLPKKIRT